MKFSENWTWFLVLLVEYNNTKETKEIENFLVRPVPWETYVFSGGVTYLYAASNMIGPTAAISHTVEKDAWKGQINLQRLFGSILVDSAHI